jgi:DNA mismatch repair ATPase MutS
MTIYENKILEYKATLARLDESLKRISMLRLVVFLIAAVLIIILANQRMSEGILFVSVIFVVAFGALVKQHNEAEELKAFTISLKKINEQEMLRLENKLSSFPGGQVFLDRDHPYNSDMDVFGSHSLFQLLNRTTTESGDELLAEWLSRPAVKEVILQRQEAVKELSPKVEWRQDFQAAGMQFQQTKSDYKNLLAWIEEPVELLPDRSRFLMSVVPLTILSTAALFYFIIQFFAFKNIAGIIPVTIIGLINAMVLKKVKRVADQITENIHQNIKILGGYQSLITSIEGKKFESDLLQRLQSHLHLDNYSAANEINSLKKTFEVFKLRGGKGKLGNGFYSIFNVLWFFDFHLLIEIEKWKVKNGSRLRGWAATVSEFEVLSSIAGFQYSNPAFSFPEIKDEPYTLDFDMLGHPLINKDRRVSNKFALTGRGEMAMITGSNMAGKSTFLRTIGVNLVLAFMGAPCCAKSARVSVIKIFSSMRTQDNLEEGVSSFYAELRRVEQLLKLIESGEAVFFMLDEMFKGTNSKDRHQGGFSLIKQLREMNAFGIISTHDLDLAILAGKHKLVTNYSFNSIIREDEIIFNYALTDGLCTDFNASALMKRSGIKILSQID